MTRIDFIHGRDHPVCFNDLGKNLVHARLHQIKIPAQTSLLPTNAPRLFFDPRPKEIFHPADKTYTAFQHMTTAQPRRSGDLMQVDSLPSLPTYPQGGPMFMASSRREEAKAPLVADVQPARREDLPSSQTEDVSKIMEVARQGLKHAGLNIRLSTDEGSERLQIEVFNPETNEVIRRFPPDEIIKLGESIKKMNGLIVNRNL